MKRIICIGNRYVRADAAGSSVYEFLIGRTVPPDVEVIDGGLGGLDLLRFVDGAEQVVFVDSICRLAHSQDAKVTEVKVTGIMTGNGYDHAAGLGYLLKALPYVCEISLPKISLIGIEATPNKDAIEKAAALALEIVSGDQGLSARCS